ncbi:hypothetical protein D9615_007902 [Tricholomella constricta]|uniref:Zn(2)-C6 fungal-type domain-containing protein n=1 Tax=Tricholomella constricta TaxID=117010 RepID=A0A8H5H4L2_9AGAR|nr:hypothetical protein D9615_007902 [Tricholomella constricta]
MFVAGGHTSIRHRLSQFMPAGDGYKAPVSRLFRPQPGLSKHIPYVVLLFSVHPKPALQSNASSNQNLSDYPRTPRRTPMACQFCRGKAAEVVLCDACGRNAEFTGRKLKCDGLRPSCSNCNRRGYPCVYTPVYVALHSPLDLLITHLQERTTGLDDSLILGLKASSGPLDPGT